MRDVGLTDDADRRRQEHGNPSDFRIVHVFTSEADARKWEKDMLAQGYEGDTGGKGWKYGYTFSRA